MNRKSRKRSARRDPVLTCMQKAETLSSAQLIKQVATITIVVFSVFKLSTAGLPLLGLNSLTIGESATPALVIGAAIFLALWIFRTIFKTMTEFENAQEDKA